MAKSLQISRVIQEVRQELDAVGLCARPRPETVPLQKTRPVKRPADLAPFIEHTLLRPDATREKIFSLCQETKQFGLRGVCINPFYVEVAKKQLLGTPSLVVSVVGFPLGANLTSTKVDETRRVIKLGADEVDMVISIGALKQGDYGAVYRDIAEVVIAAGQVPVKVILETVFLNTREKIAGCLLAMLAGAAYAKTSTGFGFIRTSGKVLLGGATVEDVRLVRKVVGENMGIKAAGGIKDYEMARRMINAGATCLGCSASVAIVSERHRRFSASS